jgi:sugar phosphate isomerase/epimerase
MTELPKLGVALLPDELPHHIDWLVDGSRDLELQGFHSPNSLLSDWRPRAAEVRKQLASHKGRQGMHGPATVPLASNDPGLRALAQERLGQGLDVCEEIGLTQMVIHSPYIHWDQENLYRVPGRRDEKLSDFKMTLEPIVVRAEKLSVELVIENIEDRDPAIRRDIVRHFASSALKLSIDTGHAFYANRMGAAPSVELFVRAAGEDLAHLHLQDADGLADRHWAIGDGSVPWRSVFEELSLLSSNPRLIIEIRDKTEVPRSCEYLINLGIAR